MNNKIKNINKINKSKNKNAKKISLSKNNKSKNKKVLSIVFYTTCSLAIAGSGSYLIYYFVTKDDFNNSWDGASEYISQRTLSLQFVYEDKTSNNGDQFVGGTGWIINKDKKSEKYYIATNLHVAASLSYENKLIYDYSESHATSYGSLVQFLVGFVDSNGSSSSLDISQTKMISVSRPTLVYATFGDNDQKSDKWNSIFPRINGASPTNVNDGTRTQYQTTADFAILEYDFSSTSLSNVEVKANNTTYTPNKGETNVDAFKNWLQNGYDKTPTKILNKPIQEVENWTKLRYSMGGFPGNDGVTDKVGTNSNFLNQQWESHSNFELSNERVSNYGTAADYYRDVDNNKVQTPIVEANATDVNGATYTYLSDTNPRYYGGYVNVALKGLLNEHSRSGSSGSMLITYLDNQPYVVGIYWGVTNFSDGSDTLSLGSADFLVSNDNGTYNGTKYGSYNLNQWSYEWLLDKGKDLYYNPITNKSND